MTRLVVIGNGFDLHHGFHTGTSDLKKCIESLGLKSGEQVVEKLQCYGLNWCKWEESLAGINLKAIEEDILEHPDYLSDHEYDRDGGVSSVQLIMADIINYIDAGLLKMIKNAENELEHSHSSKDVMIESDDMVISFNYTSTVEKLYHVENHRICHIHGCYYYEDSDLIYGYRDEVDDYDIWIESFHNEELWDYYMDAQRNEVFSFYKSLKKRFQFDKISAFLSRIMDVIEVVIMGHSLGRVDAQYIEKIYRTFPNAKWVIFFHGNDDIVLQNVKKYPFLTHARYVLW